MNPSRQTRQLVLILLLAVSLVVLLNQGSKQNNTTPTSASEQEKPAAFSTSTTVRSYKGVGPYQLAIQSSESIFYESSGRVELKRPEILFTTKQGDHFQVQAISGYYRLNEEIFTLQGDVLLSGTSNNPDTQAQNLHSVNNMTLRTEALVFDAKTRFISTDEAVTIEQGPHSLEAVGFSISIDERNMNLHQKVKGRYVIDAENS